MTIEEKKALLESLPELLRGTNIGQFNMIVESGAKVVYKECATEQQPVEKPGPKIVAEGEYVDTDELFHFIHPAADSQQEWQIHDEVKRLVTRQGIQEICKYLTKLESEEKIYLPQSADTAYTELVRMGMPSGDGFSIKTFMKYYRK